MQANYRKRKDNLVYETYVTNSLRNVNEIIANIYGGESMQKKYIDIYRDMKGYGHHETRTGQEIREDIGNKLDKIGAS